MATTAKFTTTAVVCTLVLLMAAGICILPSQVSAVQKQRAQGRLVSGAGPRITYRFNTKTKNDDRMFPVKSGERITFSVKARGAAKYEWQVNKKRRRTKVGSFSWTVPEDKGIWEIHVKADNKHGQAHQEWVVSNLTEDKAPDFFEYFADGAYSGRQETDPWARALKEWQVDQDYDVPDVRNGWMEPGKGGQRPFSLRAPSDAAYGTWRFMFRFPMGFFIPPNGGSGPRTQIYYTFIRQGRGGSGHAYRYNKVSDGHNYFYARSEPTWRKRWAAMGDEDSGFKQRRRWYIVTIVRTRDGWIYSYVTDIEKGRTYLQFRGFNKVGETSSYVRMSLNRPLWDMFPRITIHVDGLEIYKDRYLFPSKSAAYGRYVENWRWSPQPVEEFSQVDRIGDWTGFSMRDLAQSEIDTINKRHPGHRVTPERVKGWTGTELRWMRGKRQYHAVYGKGIVVQGRGVTLDEIDRMLNDPARLRYDSQKKAWICDTDLVVDEGAELVIEDTTLRMRSAKPGQRKIAVMYGATVRIKNSIVTSDTRSYFLWRFTGAANHGYNLGMETGGINALSYGSFGSFLVEDSTIDNCANLFLDAPREVRFKNVRLTNLHQADAGEYSASPGTETQKRKNFVKGAKSFAMFIKNYNVFGFDLDGITFSAAGTPVDIIFRLNSDKNRLNVRNSDFGSENIVVKPSVKMMSFWNSRWPEYYNSVLGLVNCRFKSIRIPEGRAFAVPKYFLDVKVVRGTEAVKGAKVTVTCEVPNDEYPPENMATEYDYFNDDPRLFPVSVKMGQPLSETTTTDTGHTPGPSDRTGTLVLPDFVQDSTGRREFTYTVTVEAEGMKKVITGVNPGPEWRRPDPERPTYTITAVLGGKTETEAKLRKKGLAGRGGCMWLSQ